MTISTAPFASKKFLSVLAFTLLLPGIRCYADTTQASGTPMKMDEPMPTKMAKPGMKEGEVKMAAKKKDQQIKPIMDEESAAAAKK